MKKKISGFTVVELIVIIAVIGIITSIAAVGYGSVQAQARNTEREIEVKAWIALFRKYKSVHGTYPDVGNNGNYCLGTGFPNGMGGVPRCRNSQSNNASLAYPESDNINLMNALRSVGTIPPGNRSLIKGDLVGPYIQEYNVANPRIRQIFEGSGDCPNGYVKTHTESGAYICAIYVNM